MKQIFPRRLAQLRNLRNMSQGTLASLCKVSKSTISLLESGFAKDVKTSTLIAISDVLAVSPDYLLGYDKDETHARTIIRAKWTPDYVYQATESLDSNGIELKCIVCDTLLRANGGQHGMADCLVTMREAGKSLAYMSSLFGLPVESIEHLLNIGYEAMRTRHKKTRAA